MAATFPFFGLPREIRDEIYRHVCGSKKMTIAIWKPAQVIVLKNATMRNLTIIKYHKYYEHNSPYEVIPFLRQLQASRQFYREAFSILFADCQFEFHRFESFTHPLFYDLPSLFQSKIRNLKITIWNGARCDMLGPSAISQLSDLRVLRINIRGASQEILELLPKIRTISSQSFPILKEVTIRYDDTEVSVNGIGISLVQEESIAQLIAAQVAFLEGLGIGTSNRGSGSH